MLEKIPAPEYDPDQPLQAHVTNLDASPYVGRLAICRVRNGTIRSGQQIAWCRADGSIQRASVSELYVTEALERVPAKEAGPGEIIAVAGIEEVTIGETLADPEEPTPLPVISVDEPSLSIQIGINTSPLAGLEGKKLTARQILDRLDAELVGNVSIRVNDIGRPDAWEVQGRGELQLVVLLEMMRREGFELTAGQPQVVTHEEDGKLHEPVERLSIDAPEEHVGADHPAAGRAQGPHGADGQPLDRLGADGVPGPGPRPDRLPHRVPHRDPRHRDHEPRLRPLGALGGRAADQGRAARSSPTAAARPPATRWPACRTAARSSSAPARRSTRG